MTFFLVDVAHSFVDHPAQWSAGAAVAAGVQRRASPRQRAFAPSVRPGAIPPLAPWTRPIRHVPT